MVKPHAQGELQAWKDASTSTTLQMKKTKVCSKMMEMRGKEKAKGEVWFDNIPELPLKDSRDFTPLKKRSIPFFVNQALITHSWGELPEGQQLHFPMAGHQRGKK